MYDIYIAEAAIETDYPAFETPEEKEAYINKVFAAHNVTQAQWDTSLSWYADRIDIYLKMNDSVKARLKRAQDEIDSEISRQNAQQLQSGDMVYLMSYIPPVYSFLMPTGQVGGFRFALDSAKIVEEIPEGDFLFTFSVIGLPPSFSSRFLSHLTMEYSDTTLFKQEEINENRVYNIPVSRAIAGDTLRKVSGFIYLQDTNTTKPNIQLYNISFEN